MVALRGRAAEAENRAPMPFDAWLRELVATLRTKLPEVRATRRGGTATLRYGELAVTIEHDGATFVVRCSGMGLLMISQHDAVTAHNVAVTLAGHFDARLSKG